MMRIWNIHFKFVFSIRAAATDFQSRACSNWHTSACFFSLRMASWQSTFHWDYFWWGFGRGTTCWPAICLGNQAPEGWNNRRRELTALMGPNLTLCSSVASDKDDLVKNKHNGNKESHPMEMTWSYSSGRKKHEKKWERGLKKKEHRYEGSK